MYCFISQERKTERERQIEREREGEKSEHSLPTMTNRCLVRIALCSWMSNRNNVQEYVEGNDDGKTGYKGYNLIECTKATHISKQIWKVHGTLLAD